MELFAYRLCHQPRQYVAGQPFPNICNAAVLEQNVFIRFLSFQSDKSSSEKGPPRKVRTWQTQPYYPLLFEISMQHSLLLTPLSDLLLDPQGKTLFSLKRKLILATWEVKGNPVRWNEIHAMQPRLYPRQEDQVLLQVRNRFWKSRLVKSSPPELFVGKVVLKIYSKFTGEHSCWLLYSFIEITLRHGCSPVNWLHIFRRPFHKNTSGGLLPTSWCVRGKIDPFCALLNK